MNRRNAAAYSAELTMDERRLASARAKAPRAAALLDLVYEADLTLPTFALGADGTWVRLNDELRRGLDSLQLVLGSCVSSGREVSDDFARKAEEMIARAEKLK